MKILIGVDGSASSLDAVRLVARLVDPASDAIAVYFSPLELEKRLPGRPRRIVEGAAAALFEEACSLLPGGFVQPIEMIASSKSAAVGLLESAAEWRADIIVVGARGHGSVERFLLGSVSRAVVHGAGLPVLIARGAPSADRGPKVLVCHRPASAGAVAATMGMLHWPTSTACATQTPRRSPWRGSMSTTRRWPRSAAVWQHFKQRFLSPSARWHRSWPKAILPSRYWRGPSTTAAT